MAVRLPRPGSRGGPRARRPSRRRRRHPPACHSGERAHLHGDPDGFDQRVRRCEPVHFAHRTGVRLFLHRPDGDRGFPGALNVRVTYTLERDDNLTLSYRAVADAPTIVSLTHHAYWNLAGEGRGNVLSHLLPVGAPLHPVDVDPISGGPHRSSVTARSTLAGTGCSPTSRPTRMRNWPSPAAASTTTGSLGPPRRPASPPRKAPVLYAPGIRPPQGRAHHRTGHPGRPYRRSVRSASAHPEPHSSPPPTASPFPGRAGPARATPSVVPVCRPHVCRGRRTAAVLPRRTPPDAGTSATRPLACAERRVAGEPAGGFRARERHLPRPKCSRCPGPGSPRGGGNPWAVGVIRRGERFCGPYWRAR